MKKTIDTFYITTKLKVEDFIRTGIKTLKNREGSWIEESGKYIVAIIITGVLMTGLVAIFKDTLLVTLKSKITEFFNFR